MKVSVRSRLDTDDLVQVLCDQLSHDQIVDFVKALDEAACDLSVTKALAEHFKNVVESESKSP